MKNKGFTLIELLAVIIILGILMIIAIPSVTKYISDSRKSSYIGTAKELVSGARNMVNDGKLEMFDTDTTYYIDVNCIKTENGEATSPYGSFTKAYVAVTYDGKGYDYYWTSVDDAGEGIKNLIKYDNLDPEQIESDLNDSNISTLRGIDGRSRTAVVSKANNCKKEGSNPATSQVSSATGTDPITYPEGKDRSNLALGDMITIGTEDFYIIKIDGNKLYLLARYNINVGSHKKPDVPEGRQDKDVVGHSQDNSFTYGDMHYSSSNYWKDKIGDGLTYPGNYCTSQEKTNCARIYDSHVLAYNYINQYGDYIRSFGVNVLEARMMTLDEQYYFRTNKTNAAVIICSTSYWIATAYDNFSVYSVNASPSSRPGSCYSPAVNYYFYDSYGIRPLIVIS